MSPEVTDDEEAKRVLDGHGERIGIVAEVRDGTAYVDPSDGIDADLKSRLGWGPTEQTTYPLRHDAIEEVGDEAIRLRGEYQQDEE